MGGSAGSTPLLLELCVRSARCSPGACLLALPAKRTTPSEETTTSTTITHSSKLSRRLYVALLSGGARGDGDLATRQSVARFREGVVGLGLGILAGTNCLISIQVETAPGTEPQISTSLAVGNYCAKVTDLGC